MGVLCFRSTGVAMRSTLITVTSLLSLSMAVSFGCAGCGGTEKPAEAPKTETEKPTSTGSVQEMPGDCVDPVSDGDRHDPTRPADHHVQPDVKGWDLDDDGVADAFVKPAWSCGQGCYRSAYVVRGTCGHYVGTFASSDRYELLDEKSHGLHDLKARPERPGDNGQQCFQVIWKYDGKQYQAARHRECECKEDSPKCEGSWTDGGL